MTNLELENKIYTYKTKYKEGFIQVELDELLKDFPSINIEKYENAFMGNTCMMRDGNTINYHCDVLKAILCGIENRDLKLEEWD